MSFSVIIPARLSSSRLPQKALADIAGKPMVVRAAEQAQKSLASRVIVATDHVSIFEACQAHQVEAIMTSDQHESGTTRLAEAVSTLKLPANEIVINVQGDEPLMPPELINVLAHQLQNGAAPMATAAHKINDFAEFMNPNCVKVVLNQKNNALYFSRAPIAYPRDSMQKNEQKLPAFSPLRHIGIYGYRVDFLKKYAQLSPSPLEQIESLEQLRVLWHGYEIAVSVCDNAPPTGVDTLEDLIKVQKIFNQIHQ